MHYYLFEDGAHLLLENNDMVEKLLTSEAKSKLQEPSLTAVTPEWLIVEKTIFATRLGQLYFETTTSDLIQEIEKLTGLK